MHNRRLIAVLGILIIGWGMTLRAQQPLSLDEAIRLAVSQAYEVQIAQSELRTAELRDYRGNAGETPRPSIGISDNAQVINTNQSLANDTRIDRQGAVANAFGANLTVNWTIFNGMEVTAIKERIRAEVALNQNLLRSTLQNIVASVMLQYYAVRRQQSYVEVIRQSLEVSEQRLKQVGYQKAAGYANASDSLLAYLDVQQRRQALESQEMVLRQGLLDLANLMNVEPGEDYALTDSIGLGTALVQEEVIAGVRANPELAAAANTVRIAEENARAAYALRMPNVQLNGGLAYNLSYNTGGFILSNQNYGPFVGVSANVPIFQGRNLNAQHNIALQQVETMRLRQAQAEDDLESAVLVLWEAYTTATAQAAADAENVRTAYRLMNLTVARHSLEAATVLELREAQRSFEEANFRLIDLRYQAKVAEVELMRLSGMLVE